MADNLIAMRLVGPGIQPDKIRVGTIARLLENFETAIASIVAETRSQISKEDIVLGLVEVKSGSLGLHIATQLPELVIPAFQRLSQTIHQNVFSGLPYEAIDALREITNVARERDCFIEFLSINGSEKILATISPETSIPKPQPIVGETTLYGKVMRIGGVDPHLMLKTIEGDTLFCNLSEDLAIELAHSLYSTVGLVGIAQWDAETLKMTNFEVQEAFKYVERSASEAMSELSSLVGEYFAEIEDVDNYVGRLREDD
jgi:hypothetical protein